jgi:hypothetical protein
MGRHSVSAADAMLVAGHSSSSFETRNPSFPSLRNAALSGSNRFPQRPIAHAMGYQNDAPSALQINPTEEIFGIAEFAQITKSTTRIRKVCNRFRQIRRTAHPRALVSLHKFLDFRFSADFLIFLRVLCASVVNSVLVAALFRCDSVVSPRV